LLDLWSLTSGWSCLVLVEHGGLFVVVGVNL
jgi:hypothetical protein